MSHTADYMFAPGWNVPLASLSNFEETFFQRNRSKDGVQYAVIISSQPVDPYPIETLLESGRVRGDGKIPHQWEIAMFASAMTHLMSYFTAKSVKWTIYTRRHELDTYARYNCWAIRPSPAAGTLVYRREKLLTASLRFSDLQAL